MGRRGTGRAGPGAWIADLGVRTGVENDADAPVGAETSAAGCGASEISSDDATLLEPRPCGDHVAGRRAAIGRKIRRRGRRSDGTLPGFDRRRRRRPSRRAVRPSRRGVRRARLEPTLEEPKPGGSGFFTRRGRAIELPARRGRGRAGGDVDEVRGFIDQRRTRRRRFEEVLLTLQPTTTGPSLSLSLSRDGRRVRRPRGVHGRGDEISDAPARVETEAVDGTLGTHRVVVNDGD